MSNKKSKHSHPNPTAYDFEQLGMQIMSRKIGSSITFERRFRTFFGTTPLICEILWTILDPFEQIAPDHPGLQVVHMLWALLFLKIYAEESVHCGLVGGVDEKTFRKWSWIFVEYISYAEDRVILWMNRYRQDNGSDCLTSSDGVDFEIPEPWPYNRIISKRWYSHKFKGPGVRYEIGLAIQTGDIVKIAGPYPCGDWPDVKIFKLHTVPELDINERVEADAGYASLDPEYTKTPESAFSTEEGEVMKNRVRARHETVNKRMKQWGCLRKVFHHPDLTKHSFVFRAVAVITQLSFENGEPLFEVDYKD